MKVQKQKKKRLIILLLVVVAIIAGYAISARLLDIWPFSSTGYDSSQLQRTDEDGDDINFSPPSEQEVKESNNAKQKLIDGSSREAGSSTNKLSVQVGVSFAEVINDQLEVRAFTPSVVEGDGKCIAKLTSGDKSITRSSVAFIDSTSTQCRPIYIATSDFPSSGSWQLVVSYSSSSSEGESSIIEVKL